jgi:hypothetical protein
MAHEIASVSEPLRRVLADRPKWQRSKVSNHNSLLPGIDGRSAQARRFRDIVAQLVQDQGGLDQMSEARLQLVRRFAAVAVIAEQMEGDLTSGKVVNITEYASLSSTLVRVAQRIGINRRLKNVTPDLQDYLEAHATETTDG